MSFSVSSQTASPSATSGRYFSRSSATMRSVVVLGRVSRSWIDGSFVGAVWAACGGGAFDSGCTGCRSAWGADFGGWAGCSRVCCRGRGGGVGALGVRSSKSLPRGAVSFST